MNNRAGYEGNKNKSQNGLTIYIREGREKRDGEKNVFIFEIRKEGFLRLGHKPPRNLLKKQLVLVRSSYCEDMFRLRLAFDFREV